MSKPENKPFKYRASWIASIEKYPFTSETSKKITIGFDRHIGKTITYAKETQEEKFCDTFDEAKQFLIAKHKKKIREMESALAFCKENLEKAEALTEEDIKDDHAY